MNTRMYRGCRFLYGWLAIAVLVLGGLPAAAQAQSALPVGFYFNPVEAGSPGGSHTLLAMKEDGTAVIAFFDLQAGQTTVYTGTWLLDPYGTVTLDLEVTAEDACAKEDAVSTITFLPSTSGDALTAVHYPSCLWGNGGLTLLQIPDEQMMEIEQAYADAGLMPGLVFQTEVIEAKDETERQYTLNLGPADHAMLITDSLDGEPPLTELGQWTANLYTVTVTLTGTVDTLYDEPEELAFGFVKDGTRSMAAYEFDPQKYGKQGLELTYQPQLPALLAADKADTTDTALEIAGIYNSDVLPTADSPGLVQTLALFETGKAQNTLNYLNGESPIVELGSWEDNEDGTVTLVIDGSLEADYSKPMTTTFTVSSTVTSIGANQQPVQQLQAEDVVLHKLPAVEPGVQPDSEESAD